MPHLNTWQATPITIDGILNLPVGSVFTYANGGQYRLVVSRNAVNGKFASSLIGETQSYTCKSNSDKNLRVYLWGSGNLPKILPELPLNTPKGVAEAKTIGINADINYLLYKAGAVGQPAVALKPTPVSYPPALQPNSTEKFSMGSTNIVLPKHERMFSEWCGKPIYDFGGKPIIDYEGKPVFAELATLRLGRQEPWDGRWVETYGMPKGAPLLFTDWIDAKPSFQNTTPIDNPGILEHLNRIASHKGGNRPFGGCWDLMFWNGNQVCFYECKRMGKDAIRETQKEWLAAAMEIGYSLDQFVVLEWCF